MKNKKFSKLVKNYFNLFIERFPEYGSFLGLHQYDGKWAEQNKEKISKEDAQRILEALQQDEQEVQEKIKKEQAKAKKIKIEKDW